MKTSRSSSPTLDSPGATERGRGPVAPGQTTASDTAANEAIDASRSNSVEGSPRIRIPTTGLDLTAGVNAEKALRKSIAGMNTEMVKLLLSETVLDEAAHVRMVEAACGTGNPQMAVLVANGSPGRVVPASVKMQVSNLFTRAGVEWLAQLPDELVHVDTALHASVLDRPPNESNLAIGTLDRTAADRRLETWFAHTLDCWSNLDARFGVLDPGKGHVSKYAPLAIEAGNLKMADYLIGMHGKSPVFQRPGRDGRTVRDAIRDAFALHADASAVAIMRKNDMALDPAFLSQVVRRKKEEGRLALVEELLSKVPTLGEDRKALSQPLMDAALTGREAETSLLLKYRAADRTGAFKAARDARQTGTAMLLKEDLDAHKTSGLKALFGSRPG